MNEIFSNLQDIIKVNTELHHQLKERIDPNDPFHSDDKCIGDVFFRLSPFLKIYSVYAKNYSNAIKCFNEYKKKNAEFAEFLDAALRSDECGMMRFEGFILTPIQRIPRYKMLLQDLLKNTPEGHADSQNLREALTSIEQVAVFLNETIRRHEVILEMLRLQKQISGLELDLLAPGRILIKRGILTKICRKSTKQRALFLFSDILIYTSVSSMPSSNVSEDGAYVFHRCFSSLDDMKISADGYAMTPALSNTDLDVSLFNTTGEDLIFHVISPAKSFALICKNTDEKSRWIEAFNSTIAAYHRNRSTLKLETITPTVMSNSDPEDQYAAPIWVPDDSCLACMDCQQLFTVIRRRHHCRACGRVLCNKCSDRRTVLPSQYMVMNAAAINSAPYVRVCNSCFDILDAKLMNLKRELLQSSVKEIERPRSADLHSLVEYESVARANDHVDEPQIQYRLYNNTSPKFSSRRTLQAINTDKTITRISTRNSHENIERSQYAHLFRPQSWSDRLLHSIASNHQSLAEFRTMNHTTSFLSSEAEQAPIEHDETSFSAIHHSTKPSGLSVQLLASTLETKLKMKTPPKGRTKSMIHNRETEKWTLGRRTSSPDLSGFDASSVVAQSWNIGKSVISYLSSHMPSIKYEPQSMPSKPTKILKTGILMKRGQRFKTWKIRWLVLTNTELIWFKPEEMQKHSEKYGDINIDDLVSENNINLLNRICLEDCTDVSYASGDEINLDQFRERYCNVPSSKNTWLPSGVGSVYYNDPYRSTMPYPQIDSIDSRMSATGNSYSDLFDLQNARYPLKLISPLRILYMIAASERDCDDWLVALTKAVNESRLYRGHIPSVCALSPPPAAVLQSFPAENNLYEDPISISEPPSRPNSILVPPGRSFLMTDAETVEH